MHYGQYFNRTSDFSILQPLMPNTELPIFLVTFPYYIYCLKHLSYTYRTLYD